MAFTAGFRWGVATAAYQIEGATAEDGRGVSVWDTFCRRPGRIAGGATGDVACDHYHRWPEDLALMADLGIDAYRFSIAWPRVQPDGHGPANGKGLDFYDRLVDGLLERGITPFPTLFHWDLPQTLEDQGGWLARDTAHRFADYAALVAGRLGDRVQDWITLNEPVVVTAYGYAFGVYAPGRTLMLDALPTAHHQLLGHGLAVAALREHGARRVGPANHYSPAWAQEESSAADRRAAAAFDLFMNRLFTEPVLCGTLPDLSALGGPDPASYVRDGDLATIAAPIDFLGVNYYQPTCLKAPGPNDPLPFEIVPVTGHPVTGMGWPVVPDALPALLRDLRDTYPGVLPPIHITENGCSYDDRPGPDGTVDDPERVVFLRSHLDAVRTALEEGIDVRGYFVWSLMDNFEWSQGYGPRFGLVHIDYDTQRRTPKTSYAWYREHIARARRASSPGG